MKLLQNSKLWASLVFALILTLICLRAYKYPEYSTDGFAYMGNAVAMSGASIQVIHDTVYREAKAGIPEPVFNHLTGNDPGEPLSESRSFRERYVNPYRFAEFLPCFAIRPLFNQLLYVLHFKLGIGLLRSIVILPVVSYWLMGWIVWAWIARYVAGPWSSLLCVLLLLISPPLWDQARSTTPDALSSLVVLLALFLLLEKRTLLPGMILLLASVYVRTDNALLVLVVLAFLYLARFDLKLWQAALLSALAVASVATINHFAGDYGARVLYYRSFVEPPIAVGEIAPRFGLADYLTALKGMSQWSAARHVHSLFPDGSGRPAEASISAHTRCRRHDDPLHRRPPGDLPQPRNEIFWPVLCGHGPGVGLHPCRTRFCSCE